MRGLLPLLLGLLLLCPAGALGGGASAPASSPGAPHGSAGQPLVSSSSASRAPASSPGPATGGEVGLPWPFHGVDRSGTEYACIQGWGYGDGPYNLTSVEAMRTWNVTAVRVPLNEDCWLDINVNGTSAATWSGAGYRQFIIAYVHLLESQGIRPILDLHWNAPGTNQSTGQEPMADESHAPAFWSSVASTFANDSLVIFDLYNEPYGISWQCWEFGCFQTYTNPGWETAGMQQLLDIVRAAGADTQLVILGGLNWSDDESGWLSHEPSDPAGPGLLAASLHMYQGTSCSSWSCWNATLLPILRSGVPIVTGEMGEGDCNATFIDSYFGWADPHDVSYLGWTWDAWNTCSGPTLIAGYNGTPYMAYGAGFRAHLLTFPEPGLLAPSPPKVTVLGQNGSALVRWSSVSNGTWPATNEELAWGSAPTSLTHDLVTGVGGDEMARVSGLTNSVAYYFAVRERNEIGWGNWSTVTPGTPALNMTVEATATPTTGNVPLLVAFHGSVTGGYPGYNWSWLFGDGTSATVQDPSHTYDTTGTFTVTASVTDASDVQAFTQLTITVGASTSTGPLQAWANASTLSGKVPLTVSFTGAGRGGLTPYTYAWAFADGGRSAAEDPTHTFNTSGTYGVKLWVNDSTGASVSALDSVDVLPASEAPLQVAIQLLPANGTAPLRVEGNAWATGGSGSYPSYFWTVGGSPADTSGPHQNFTLGQPGTYLVTVQVRDTSGLAASNETNATVVANATLCLGCGSILGLPSSTFWDLLWVAAGLVVLALVVVVLVVVVRRRPPPPPAPAASSTALVPYPEAPAAEMELPPAPGPGPGPGMG